MRFQEIVVCKWQQFNLSPCALLQIFDDMFVALHSWSSRSCHKSVQNRKSENREKRPQRATKTQPVATRDGAHKICRQIKAKAKQLSCFSLWHWPFLCFTLLCFEFPCLGEHVRKSCMKLFWFSCSSSSSPVSQFLSVLTVGELLTNDCPATGPFPAFSLSRSSFCSFRKLSLFIWRQFRLCLSPSSSSRWYRHAGQIVDGV